MSNLLDQLTQALAVFESCAKPPALIGGLALAAHHVVRATSDIDFLVASEDGDQLHTALLALGYVCLHRSDDAANYLRGDEGLDFLYAHRPLARDLLQAAEEHMLGPVQVRVVSVEGLIGFKLQALVNNPKRPHDRDDIRKLLRENRSTLDMQQVKRYFTLFDRVALMEELLVDID